MATIDRMTVNGTTYNIADTDARLDVSLVSGTLQYRKRNADAVANNYGLDPDGTSVYNTQMNLLKFAVTAGDRVLIKVVQPPLYKGAWQWQSESNVPETGTNPYLIGETGLTATYAEVVAPSGANWLIISAVKTDTVSGAYISEPIDNIGRINFAMSNGLTQRVTPYQVAAGYRLIADGRCEANANYKLVKFRTSPGRPYYLRGYTDGGVLYQFQSSPGVSVSSSAAIGTPVSVSTEGMVTPPGSGYYLIMSVPAQDNVSGIYTINDRDLMLPDYWQTYLEETGFPKLDANKLTVGNHGVSFVFITDQHTEQKAGNLIHAVCRRVHGEMLVNGGDLINGSSDKAYQVGLIRGLMDAVPGETQYTIRGNHDGNMNYDNASAVNRITDGEFYALTVAPYEHDVVSDGNLYYYRDNTNQKIRFIFLDTGEPDTAVISDAQIEWMTSRITELSSDWTVVIFAHQVYTSLNNIDPSGTKISNALNSLTGGAHVACIVSGHTHKDQSYTTDGGVPIIITTALNAAQESTTQGTVLTRTWGTTTEFAIDVFFIDTQSKSVMVSRIGAGADRAFTYA